MRLALEVLCDKPLYILDDIEVRNLFSRKPEASVHVFVCIYMYFPGGLLNLTRMRRAH